MKDKKGFSLLELTLVLGVGSLMAFVKFQDMRNEQETVMANAVGTQIKQLGEAVNRYISVRYDKLSTLSNAAGTGNFGSNITSGGTITAVGEVVAHNGYGDTITLGGDASGNDYEIRLALNKPLTVWSPNATNTDTVLQTTQGNAKFANRIATNGLDPNNLPSGWGGGVRTLDVYASGTIAAGDNSGNIRAYINSSGNLYASGSAQVDGNISSSNQITSNGRLTTNEFLQINGQASVGGGCSPNGLQGRTSAGQLLSCVNGVWTNTTSLKRMVFMISGETKNYGDICQKYLDNNGYTALGWVASGSDACTEDEEYCTIDNVRCFALKTQ